MLYLSQTFAKQEAGHQNQDAASQYILDNQKFISFGIADGAGGYGIFSGDWARQLVQNLPPTPIQNHKALDAWLDSWCSNFIDYADAKAKSLNYLYNKLYSEGSAATLVAVWLEPDAIHLLSYGDSFYALRLADAVFLPPQRQNISQYQQNPHLLNWLDQECNPDGFSYQKIALPTNTNIQLLACTDAIGQFLLALYHKEIAPTNLQQLAADQLRHDQRLARLLQSDWTWTRFWQQIPAQLQTQKTFADWIQTLYTDQLLAVDDCTAIFFTT